MTCGCNKNNSENLEHKGCGCHHDHHDGNHDCCQFDIANMSEEDKRALKEKEEKLKMETGKDFILIAYEKK